LLLVILSQILREIKAFITDLGEKSHEQDEGRMQAVAKSPLQLREP